MRCLTVVIFILIGNCLFSQYFYRYTKNDSLYVWANSGLNLRETIDENSKVITTIPFGELVVVDSIFRIDETEVKVINSIKIDNHWTPEYYIKGKRVKIKYKDFKGFVFIGFLSTMKPILCETQCFYFSLDSVIEKQYGVFKTFNRDPDEEHSDIEIIFNNGYIYTFICGVNWGESSICMPNFPFDEGVLIISNYIEKMNKYNKDTGFIWYIKEIKDNYIKFTEMSEMHTITISKINNLVIITEGGSN
ncbi:MAG: SH3 domain-containing protein [Bacteroidota bacterium]